jgi:hypothetical protein
VKQPHVLLRLVAVASSVLLAGSFISYQAGAFNRFMAPSAPASESASDSTSETYSHSLKLTDAEAPHTPELPQFQGRMGDPITIMSGTKSFSAPPDLLLPRAAYDITIGPPAATPRAPSLGSPPPSAAPPPNPTIMGGSKSIIIGPAPFPVQVPPVDPGIAGQLPSK